MKTSSPYFWKVFAIMLVSGSMFYSLYNHGYIKQSQINKSLRPFNASIRKHIAIPVNCSYSCNCYQDCDSYGEPDGYPFCKNICDICYHTCYKHQLKIGFSPDAKIVHKSSKQVVAYDMYKTNSSQWNNTKYRVGKRALFYYNVCPLNPISEKDIDNCLSHRNMSPLALELYDTRFLAFGCFMTFIAFVCSFLSLTMSDLFADPKTENKKNHDD